MSEEKVTLNLYQKIVKVMEQVGKLQKDGEIKDKNGKKMYSYLSEEQTTSTLQKAFIEFGLVMFPVQVEESFFYVEGSQYDKPFKNPIAKVMVTYKIVCADSGQSELIHSIGYGSDNADKSSNKAMTNAFKYAQRQTFMISSGEDSDHTSRDEITERNTSSTTPPKTQQQQNQPNTQARQQNAATPPASVNVRLVTEGQSKMLYAKAKAAEVGYAHVSDFLKYEIKDFKEVHMKDVNNLIKMLDERKTALDNDLLDSREGSISDRGDDGFPY